MHYLIVHVSAFGVRRHDRGEKFLETNEHCARSRCRTRRLFGTRERYGTEGRNYLSLLTKITVRVYSCPLCFVGLERIREEKESSIFTPSKPILFANMLVLVFDLNDLSIVLSIPHYLLHSMKSKRTNLLSYHVTLRYIIRYTVEQTCV